MFLYLSKFILRYGSYFLSIIAIITSVFFYQAFFSENHLKIDFSLEQMFPKKDDDKDYYDFFKNTFGREDNTIFLSFTNDNIFGDSNLSILEYISNEFQSIDNIDNVYSLGNLWDDGDGKIGYDLSESERRLLIEDDKIYSGLLSNDGKSSLILLSINENVNTHEERTSIFSQIDLIKKSLEYVLVYDGISFLDNSNEIKSFYNKINKSNDDILFIIKNSNVLSETSVGPYSILNEFDYNIKQIYPDLEVSSIEDCYDLINSQNEENIDIELNSNLIKTNCNAYQDLIDEELNLFAVKVGHDFNDISSLLKVRKFLIENSYINFKKWKWHEAGLPVLRTRYVELVEYERTLFIPIAFLIAAITLVWVFRQIKALMIALLSIIISIIWISGIMALMNVSINVISYLTFNLLMIIGVSDAIHLLMKYHEEAYSNDDKFNALQNVIVEIGAALLLTSFTTAIGFLSLSIANIKILQEFGIIMAIGICILFIITIIVMPIVLSYIDKPDEKHIKRLILKKDSSLTYFFQNLVKRKPRSIIYLSILIFALSIYGLYQIDSNVTVMGDLKPGNKLHTDLNFVENNFGGTLPLEIVISYDDSQLLTHNLEFQKKYLIFVNELHNYDIIKSVTGYWDLDGNQNIQQSKYINNKRDQLRISCGIKSIDSEEAKTISTEIINLYEQIFKNNNIKLTGSTLLSLKMNNYMIKSLLNSFVIAFFIIFISMNLLFKSFKLSLVSIIPNIFPLIFAGGVMGFSGISLRPATAMTFSIALGIAVDDTIHFLSRFRSEYKKTNSHSISSKNTILTTGRAIIGTTVTLAMGFVVLIFSNFKPNAQFGILSTIILIIALLASLLLLPSLINVIKPLKDK